MPNRILKESICTSDTIDQLTTDEENFFYRLLVNCDDYGRMDGRIKIISAKCYPLKTINLDDMTKRLVRLLEVGLIKSYVANELPYLQVKTWDKHQQVRAKRSKYPEPTTETFNGYQLISDDSICPRNPIQSNPIQSNPIRIQSKSESNTNLILEEISPNKFDDDSIEFSLASELYNLILKNNPNAKSPDLQSWAKSFDLMIRRDNRNPVDIQLVMNWSQEDSFWMGNILSPTALRKQFDKLTVQMRTRGKPQGKQTNKEKSWAALDNWSKMTEGLIK